MRKLNSGEPAGYGPKDRQLAEDLRTAGSAADRNEIAKADGHKDAEGAAKWLKDRS